MSTSAARKRSNKQRERAEKHAGKVYIAFWTDEAALAAKVDAAGTIDPNFSDDPKALSDATRRLVEALEIRRVAGDAGR